LSNETFTVNWTYTSYDCCGPFYDPAGYILNGVYTQLTDSGGNSSQSGVFTASVLLGQTYGLYVYSVDSLLGRGEISAQATTPLPSTWLMLLSGFLGLGFFAYRGSKKNSAALAGA
jgi:hypothetical protein